MKKVKEEQELRKNVESGIIPEFYSNGVKISITPYDIEIANIMVDSAGELKAALNLRMSPQTAKAFSEALTAQLENYEREFGKIPEIKESN